MIHVHFNIKFSNTLGDPEYLALLRKICSLFGNVFIFSRDIWGNMGGKSASWSLSEGLQHGGQKPVETSGVYFGSLKAFIVSVTLENSRIGTSLNILVTQNSKT